MNTKNMIKEKPSKIRRSYRFISRNKMSSTSETVANDENRIITMGKWKFNNKIHRDRLPRAFRNRKRLKKSIRFVPQSLYVCTNVTSGNIVMNIGRHSRPSIVAENKCGSSSTSRMASYE